MILTRALSKGNLDSGLGNLDADWIRSVVGYWDLNGNDPNGFAHDQAGDMHGTLVNAPTYAAALLDGRQAGELNGNNSHFNLGDLTYLNAVSAFTIAFWMNQDVLDVTDYLFRKVVDANNQILLATEGSGQMQLLVRNGGAEYGWFDYSTVISAGSWHHVAVVFDGSQTGNANRLLCYVNGNPIALTFVGTIQPTTANLVGQVARIGYTAVSFDGKLFDFIICNAALSARQARNLYWRSLHGEL